MISYSKAKVLTKRVPTVVDFTENIQRWDTDNLYPQRALEVIKRAYPLKQALETLSDFINGEGFADETLAKLVVNTRKRRGQTMNAVLSKLSKPAAQFHAFVLHIGYNLNYRISSIEVKPIEHFRFGHPDSNGEHNKIFHCLNWERDSRKMAENDRIITSYDLFNPDPAVVAEQVTERGGICNYKGQVYFVCENQDDYPLATFDTVWEHAEAIGESALAKISAIRNGFGGTIAVVYPGNFESEQERRQFQEYIEGKSGAAGTNSRIGIEDKSGTRKASDMFQQLAPPRVDRLWEYTETSAAAAILENYAQPKELQGVRPESGMFNQENMLQAYTYYNSRTRNYRNWITEVFVDIMQYWDTPITTTAEIIEQQYIVNGQPVTETPATPTLASGAPAPAPTNDAIKNLSGRQMQNFSRIVSKYAKGVINKAQAAQLLKAGFNLSDEEVEVWLSTEETTP